MRVTIATNNVVKGLDSFTDENIRELSKFGEVPVMGPDGVTLGFAHTPEVDEGSLTAELTLHREVPDGIFFSVAYTCRKGGYDPEEDEFLIGRLRLREVIVVNHNFHD